MSISPAFLNELRSRIALSELIGRRIKVTRAGREFKACCPFHHEKTPSFTINDDKQFFHCFGCGAHGDHIGFVMQHDNLSFMDAVEMLAAQAGMQVPRMTKEERGRAEKQKDLHSLMADAATYFQNALYDAANKDVLDYVRKRGISDHSIELFMIGYAPDDGQALRHYLKDKGYSDEQMIEVALLKASTRGGQPYAFFRDRVMVPVLDRRKRVVAFGGRILPEHMRVPQKNDFKPPKYINSSETPIFHKGHMLFGEPHARQAAAEGQSLIVVEGYMDVIACVQYGFHGALAPMGTALTEEQIVNIWKMIPDHEKTPILCFDGDNAGRRAAERACARILPLLGPDRSVKIAFMPNGEDPDSLLRTGGAPALQNVLGGSLSLFDFLWASESAGRKIETPEQRAGFAKAMREHSLKINDADVRRHYQELISKRISDEFFSDRDKNAARGPKQTNPHQSRTMTNPYAIRLRKPVFAERDVTSEILLAGLINHPHIWHDIEESFCGFAISSPRLADLRQYLALLMHEDHERTSDELIAKLRAKGFEKDLQAMLSPSVYIHASFVRPDTAPETVAGKWLECWHDNQEKAIRCEIQSGWRNAFDLSNQEEEERLKAMLRMEKLGDSG